MNQACQAWVNPIFNAWVTVISVENPGTGSPLRAGRTCWAGRGVKIQTVAVPSDLLSAEAVGQ